MATMSENPPIVIPIMPPVLRPESLECDAELEGVLEGFGAVTVLVDGSGTMV